MWRRAHLLLVLVRLYFALSPSYLHPDENFQGPEVIAGQIFTYPTHLTWEFTTDNPIRSIFPLWPVYGLPMLLLRSVWSDAGDHHDVSPAVVFYTLRLLMFVLSFVLEDWAIHELVPSPRHRRIAVLLVASSYVTWTYQTHTFSNSVETLLVLWSLVFIQRIVDNKQRSSIFTSAMLSFLIIFGIFNRITFPAFLFIPGLRLFPHFYRKPLSLISMLLFGFLTTLLAITLDTSFYTRPETPLTLRTLLSQPIITPLNNFLYNSYSSNLALHGSHPHYQHLLANLPQLLGPASLLLFVHPPRITLPLISAISGVFVLSLYSHQEARFLIPTIPLILSSVRLPASSRYTRPFLVLWVAFNLLLGLIMGVYHQGGVVPTQLFLANQPDATRALWWRTYSPPIWLLDGKALNLTTTDLQGVAPDEMITALQAATPCSPSTSRLTSRASQQRARELNATYLIAPSSSTFLDRYTADDAPGTRGGGLRFERAWEYKRHLNLDDLDFGGETGFWGELGRVIGRRGLRTWRVTKDCKSRGSGGGGS